MSVYREPSPPPRPTLWRAVRTHCGPELSMLASVAWFTGSYALGFYVAGPWAIIAVPVVHVLALLAYAALVACGTVDRIVKAYRAWQGHSTEAE